MKRTIIVAMMVATSVCAKAQGSFSGDLQTNVNFFQRDPTINAANNPLYDNLLSGGEAWLSARYSYKGFTGFLRADAFHNSNLYKPEAAFTQYGIGAWSISKEIKKLTITGGYIYDQVGSGIMFRAYEDRGLLIDNALVGLHLRYQLNDHIMVKGFTGQMKNVFKFNRYEPIVKGFNAEGDYQLGENVHIVPGIGALNRTWDPDRINQIATAINNLPDVKSRFVPTYNTYAFTAYNTLTAGNFSWYAEGVYKTHEAIFKDGRYQDLSGSVLYTTLGYARKGIAVNFNGKRTENFSLRANLQGEDILAQRGSIAWQPVIARIRPQRLMARYTPASQDLSEMALGGDVLVSPNDNIDLIFNYTHINTLADTSLYREVYGELNFRGVKNWTFQIGLQYLNYNQALYQVKPNAPMVKALTPFIEVVHRINDKQSIRTEWQYMYTKQDYGSWLYGLVEFNIAPKWSFALSDMYTVDLNPHNLSGLTSPQHYYNIFVARTQGPHRFTLQYVRQVDGINCTGGVCRYEPAFSGVKFSVTSSF
ncbi:MAG: hypothetical protein JST52_10955 [Bacteroidetes bacterium]|nr:hypothetical protein [Bacteroidota bacterium]MBS1739698.1 hypothetical protein [Bacteroidota bacterium]